MSHYETWFAIWSPNNAYSTSAVPNGSQMAAPVPFPKWRLPVFYISPAWLSDVPSLFRGFDWLAAWELRAFQWARAVGGSSCVHFVHSFYRLFSTRVQCINRKKHNSTRITVVKIRDVTEVSLKTNRCWSGLWSYAGKGFRSLLTNMSKQKKPTE